MGRYIVDLNSARPFRGARANFGYVIRAILIKATIALRNHIELVHFQGGGG